MRVVSAESPSAVELFWDTILNGGLVAYPTDTQYGLGADAFNMDAIRKIARLKGRPGPFSVMLGSLEQVQELAEISRQSRQRSTALLPGPYTLILNPLPDQPFPKSVLAENGTLGFRVPAHPFVNSAYSERVRPVVTTSINRTGAEPLQKPRQIERIFSGEIDLLVDAGVLPPSNGSTIFFCVDDPWTLIRKGDGRVNI